MNETNAPDFKFPAVEYCLFPLNKWSLSEYDVQEKKKNSVLRVKKKTVHQVTTLFAFINMGSSVHVGKEHAKQEKTHLHSSTNTHFSFIIIPPPYSPMTH